MAFHVVENCIKLEFTVLDLLSLKFKTYKLVDFIMIITGRSVWSVDVGLETKAKLLINGGWSSLLAV